MATLEDKILGEKLQNYCSSSEDEQDSDYEDAASDGDCPTKQASEPADLPSPNAWNGTATNTGPKGVIEDWRKFKQLEAENREELKKERIALAKKLTLTCRTEREDQQAKEEDELDDELKELLEDDFLMEYQKKRMQELMEKLERGPKFGSLMKINDRLEFLDAIESEDPKTTIVIHVCDDKVEACRTMDGCLSVLAAEYPQIKFSKISAEKTGLSRNFVDKGVPALLVYKGGQLIGNLISVTDDLGEDFFAVDVERFLIEYGFLPQKV